MAKLEYYRWWDERLLELQRRIFDTVKQQLPEVVVFSPNYYFSDGIEAHDYIKVANYADIILCVAYARIRRLCNTIREYRLRRDRLRSFQVKDRCIIR